MGIPLNSRNYSLINPIREREVIISTNAVVGISASVIAVAEGVRQTIHVLPPKQVNIHTRLME